MSKYRPIDLSQHFNIQLNLLTAFTIYVYLSVDICPYLYILNCWQMSLYSYIHSLTDVISCIYLAVDKCHHLYIFSWWQLSLVVYIQLLTDVIIFIYSTVDTWHYFIHSLHYSCYYSLALTNIILDRKTTLENMIIFRHYPKSF